MATNKIKPPAQVITDVKVKRSREAVMTEVCELLEKGVSLQRACATISDAPTAGTVLDWVEKYPAMAEQYAYARSVGYKLLADEIIAISDEADVEARYQNEDVKLVLDATAVARNRLRIDTRKWMLSKMLPKVYGDKITSEVTGANGGPVQVAALSLNGLSDTELAQMSAMLTKASAGGV
jgi:hypothetical protein